MGQGDGVVVVLGRFRVRQHYGEYRHVLVVGEICVDLRQSRQR